MNANNFFQVVQQGFHITVGAAASLVETIQDPQKREATLNELKTELNEKTEAWAEKGEITEQEARKFVDNFLKQKSNYPSSNKTTNSQEPTSKQTTTTNANAAAEIKKLTEQIIALRKELETLRD